MRKQLLILSALFVSMTVFSQKEELKNAEKAIKSNDFNTAIAAINQAEASIAGTDDKTKAKFYYLKGMALYQNGANLTDVIKIGNAFNELLKFENDTKTFKYSEEVGGLINMMVNNLAKKGTDDYNYAIQTKAPTDYLKAAKSFEEVYNLSPRDTVFLDNAALVYALGENYNTSIDLYEKLLALNYTGITTIYVATSKATGEEIVYNSKKELDLQVKLGLVENPKEEKKESRREFMFKNLAQNNIALGNNNKAMEYLTIGRKEFPKSYSLLIDEANLHYKNGNNDLFKAKLEEAIQLNPTEPTLYYNVGVMNMDQKKLDEAIKFFKKSIELKPDYADAYNNIGAAIIEKATPIIEEMNRNLNDFAKYDKLQAKQFDVYRQAVPYYEKAFEINKTSISVVQTLMGLYENLEMTEKLKAIKPVYEALKQ
ncbi:tetratricopeptide repeat protein [Lutibacter sp.]|uniref:tetratricopeptide repeat protein n=1 Tax=Lutibacter sp. TaxID=1925666 RepID=UPI0027337303|nr:tetratricopeptide repeat protein [Lutibacter sp.]MDP3314181.1 tetratricopeptide repeat protein [Lutibacter sp.]